MRFEVPIRERIATRVGNFSIYTAGRLIAVGSRPLLLFLTNNYLGQHAAEGLGIVFLANALGLAAIAADPHRRFYALYFGQRDRASTRASVIYLSSVGALGIAGTGVAMVIGVFFAHSFAL